MAGNEPKIVNRTLQRQGIAALLFQDGAADLEGANPLAPPNFLDEKTARQAIYATGSRLSSLPEDRAKRCNFLAPESIPSRYS